MSGTPRVLIVGGGIGGLALGTALGQSGIFADVVEVASSSRVHGVGIIQPGNVLRALRTIGALEPCLAHGYAYQEWRVHDHQGRCLGAVPSAFGGSDYPPWNGISRGVLHEILARRAQESGARVRLGTTVSSLTPDATGVDVVLSDGAAARYDLVVGFDGIRSSTRQRIFGSIVPSYTGYAVWRFTTERPETLQYGGIYYKDGSKVGLVPISDRQMYLFLVTAEPDNPRKDPSAYHEELAAHLAGYDGVVGAAREQLHGPDGVVYSPLEQVNLPGAWFKGRVLLCGDAAHASTPHLAQGAAMAIEDAVVLAELLAQRGPIDGALDAFMLRRQPRCRAVQQVSYRLLIGEMNPVAAAQLPPPDVDMDIERLLCQPV